jgi:hypothetical protein
MSKSVPAVLCMLFVLALAGGGAVQARADLSGTWVAELGLQGGPRAAGDDEEPPAGGRREATELRLVIEQKKDGKLVVTRSVGSDQHQRSETLELEPGKTQEVASRGPRGASVVTRSAWEGEKLVVTTTRVHSTPRRGELKIELQQVYSLSQDGKTLTVETLRKGPQGENRRSVTYQRA